MDSTKRCSRCGIEKPLDEFFKASGGEGHRASCKPCHQEVAHRKRRERSTPWGTAEERFWKCVNKDGPNGCWLWTRVRPNGDPVSFHFHGSSRRPRRVVMALQGISVAEDEMVDSTCGTVLCVNPDHLFVRLRTYPVPPGYKRCSGCKENKPLEEFAPTGPGKVHGYCKTCHSTWARTHRLLPGVRERMIRVNRARRFGLTLEEYDSLVQRKVCAICGGPGEAHGLCIDHSHAEGGGVRDLLCASCNTGIAMFKDDPDRLRSAIAYLEKWAMVSVSTSVGASTL